MTAAASQWQELLGEWARPGEVVDGKYRLDRIIGTGGMGVVIEAWHVRFDEQVALKILLPDAAANEETRLRFEREARAAFKIKSEHVARVLDVGTLPQGAPFMVMEFLDGQDLADMLGRSERFEIRDAVDHVLQACAGLAAAHAIGIVHRDLKPENLFLVNQRDGTPCIKVLDFGISKVTGASGVRMRALTSGSVTMGTPHYMAPEQWQSARDVTFAADFWALGVILFELLSGKTPFQARELAELCAAVLKKPPQSLRESRPDVPVELEAAVMRCLEKDTAHRFGSAAELARALVPFASSRGRASARRIVGVREEDVPTSSDPVTRRKGVAVLHASRENVSTMRSARHAPQHVTVRMADSPEEKTDTLPSGSFPPAEGAPSKAHASGTKRVAIVIGAMAALLAIGAIGFFMMRPREAETTEVVSEPVADEPIAKEPPAPPPPLSSPPPPSPAPSVAPSIKPPSRVVLPSAPVVSAPPATPSPPTPAPRKDKKGLDWNEF